MYLFGCYTRSILCLKNNILHPRQVVRPYVRCYLRSLNILEELTHLREYGSPSSKRKPLAFSSLSFLQKSIWCTHAWMLWIPCIYYCTSFCFLKATANIVLRALWNRMRQTVGAEFYVHLQFWVSMNAGPGPFSQGMRVTSRYFHISITSLYPTRCKTVRFW